MASLTGLQQAWLDAYLGAANFNATEAARLAGYKASDDSGFAAIGYQNKNHPDISAEIERRLSESAMSANEVLARLAEQARANVGQIMLLDQAGNLRGFDWQKVKALGHLVKSISFTANGPKVEFYDAQAALVQLGKAHGVFKEQVEHSGSIQLEQVEQAAVRFDDYLARLVAAKQADGDSAGSASGED